MNLRPQHRRSAEITIAVTPLIDVILVLLIFFMVTTTFKTDEARLRVQLPKAQGDSVQSEEPVMIQVVIDRAGRFFINDHEVADARVNVLAGVLAQQCGGNTRIPVVIQADANTPHQAVMTAMDAASQAGLQRIAFAATRPDGATP